MMSAASVPPHSGEADGARPSRTRSLRARPDSHSSVLRERPFGVLPGDVPFHLSCLSGASRANAPRATQSSAGWWTTHPVRALAGLQFSAGSLWLIRGASTEMSGRACVVAQVSGPSRAQLLEAVLFLLAACRAYGCAGVDRSPRACPGRAVCSFLHFAGFGVEGVPAPACAAQPLENSKASTSIFVLQATKSQR